MLGTDDIRSLNGITTEEDWLNDTLKITNSHMWFDTYPIQANNIIITLSRIEFDGKSTWITGRIWELPAKRDGGKANEDWCLLARALEKVRLA